MKRIQWDTLFLARLAGIPDYSVSIDIPPPVRAVFTKRTAPLAASLLSRKTIELFLPIFACKPVYFLTNDRIEERKAVDARFWELLPPLWQPEQINSVWQSCLKSEKQRDISTSIKQWNSPSWLLLQWGRTARALEQKTILWLPKEKIYQPDYYNNKTPFFLRAIITETLCLLVEQHSTVWKSAYNNSKNMADLILQNTKESLPWEQIKAWLNLLDNWANRDSLSYEDGDFLSQIILHHSLRKNYTYLRDCHREHGIPFGKGSGEDVKGIEEIENEKSN